MNKILVNLFDRHNQGSLLAIDKFKPEKVIYIIDNNIIDIFKEIEFYERNIYPKISFENHIINNENIIEIKNILSKLPVEDTIINVTGGNRISSLILLNEALNFRFNIIYIDVLDKFIYEFGHNMHKSNFDFKDISLDIMLKLTGMNLVADSTTLSEKSDIVDITKKIYKNLSMWYKYKQKLSDNNIFIHDYYNSNKIFIKLDNMNLEEKRILKSCLVYLKNKNGITYNITNNEIEVKFLNDYLKGFIFKSGTWLEVLTNIVVKEISEVDEVKSGVIFLWNECNKQVKNELDVIAVKDSVFICISCKDSEKYDEDALNELEVYSKRLGGNIVKKILVATRLPCKQCVIERAKAMGINLIILEKDINNFKKLIENAILN